MATYQSGALIYSCIVDSEKNYCYNYTVKPVPCFAILLDMLSFEK